MSVSANEVGGYSGGMLRSEHANAWDLELDELAASFGLRSSARGENEIARALHGGQH